MGTLYNHGHAFSEKLAENIKDGLERVKLKKATCIVIDGGVGEGKTTLAVHIADYINKLNGLPEINLEVEKASQIGMGGKEFSHKMAECYRDKLPVIIYDEAGDYARRQAMTSFNAYLNRIFETYRAFKIVVIICLPNQYVLDNTLFDNKIPRMILHLSGRTGNQGNFSGYSLGRIFYVRGLMRKIEDKNYAYTVVEPNFYGHFLDLSPERSEMLDKLTISGKIDILKKTQSNLSPQLNLAEISEKTGLTVNGLRNKLARLKIRPAQTIKNTSYYSVEQLDFL